MQNWNVEKGPGKTCHFFSLFFENIQKHNFFFIKLIGQRIQDGDGRGIARDIKQKKSFLKLDKNGNKFGQLPHFP